MKKQAWPWVGSTESEMASLSPAGDSSRDIATDTQSRYDMLSPAKYIHEDMIPTDTGAEGMRNIVSPTTDEMVEDQEEIVAFRTMLRELEECLGDEDILLASGPIAEKVAEKLSENDLNIISLEKSASDDTHSFKLKYNPTIYKSAYKIDKFILDLSKESRANLNLSLNNISDQLTHNGSGLIIASKGQDLVKEASNAGLLVKMFHSGSLDKAYVINDVSSKTAVARYYDESSNESASFVCDIADTAKKKLDGLQVYSRLKDECGLVFPYKRATDVMFHMGSVSYPIDIIFIDDNDNIKKISKNIQPGSLDIFSCSGIKNVLEVSGGTCDLLDIKVGRKMYISKKSFESKGKVEASDTLFELGIRKVAFKNSSNRSPAAFGINNSAILRAQNNELPSTSDIVRRFSRSSNKKKKVAIDLDSFLSTMDKIRLYRSYAPDVDKKVYSGIYNETFSINKTSYIDIAPEEFFQRLSYEKLNKMYSFVKGASYDYNFSEDNLSLLNKIADSSSDVIVVSRRDVDKELVEVFIERAIKNAARKSVSLNTSLFRVPESFGTESVYKAASYRFGDLELYSSSLIKESGMPVSDGVKGEARRALEYLGRAGELCGDLKNNFSKNLEAYEKVSGQQDVIAGSKGKYNESCKRNSRIAKRMLLNIKESIQILNKIKDISTTAEVIGAIAEAAKGSSESISEITDLVRVIDTESFMERLTESTGKVESTLDDTLLTIDRAKDYVNSNILGILVITE